MLAAAALLLAGVEVVLLVAQPWDPLWPVLLLPLSSGQCPIDDRCLLGLMGMRDGGEH